MEHLRLHVHAVIVFIVFAWCPNAHAQNQKELFLTNGFYSDIGAELTYMVYYKTGLTWIGKKNFTISSSIKVGYGKSNRNIFTNLDDTAGINWIHFTKNPWTNTTNPYLFRKHVDIPSRKGIQSLSTYDLNQYFANISLLAGWTWPLYKKVSFQFLSGIGLRYTDARFIGEAGNARFDYENVVFTEQEFFYIVPVYQRGFDYHFSAESNLIMQISDQCALSAGLLSDFSFGFMTVGIGNYYHLGGSILLKLR